MNNKIMLLIISSLLSLSSCEMTLEEKYQATIGKEIKIPTNLAYTIMGKDTVECPLIGEYKIISYVDSKKCLSCNLRLSQWRELYREMEEQYIDIPALLLYINPPKLSDAIDVLKKEEFDWPVCIDLDDTFNKENELYEDDMFRTFLLNNENQIVLIGSPLSSDNIKKLYFQELKCKED